MKEKSHRVIRSSCAFVSLQCDIIPTFFKLTLRPYITQEKCYNGRATVWSLYANAKKCDAAQCNRGHSKILIGIIETVIINSCCISFNEFSQKFTNFATALCTKTVSEELCELCSQLS
jgi:hypothetical protein